MTLAPDEDLMLQVRDGAGEMLGVLFDRYQTPLFNFYSKLTGNRTLSEDLVQEVFLRILKYRQSYRPGTPFRAWIYQIARNARIDHFRKFPAERAFEPEMLPAVIPSDSAQEQQETELQHRADCSEEVAVWRKLSLLPIEQPSPMSRVRFEAMLQAYLAGSSNNPGDNSAWRKRASSWNFFHWLRSPLGAAAW